MGDPQGTHFCQYSNSHYWVIDHLLLARGNFAGMSVPASVRSLLLCCSAALFCCFALLALLAFLSILVHPSPPYINILLCMYIVHTTLVHPSPSMVDLMLVHLNSLFPTAAFLSLCVPYLPTTYLLTTTTIITTVTFFTFNTLNELSSRCHLFSPTQFFPILSRILRDLHLIHNHHTFASNF